eukprot:g4788.t1
MLGPVLMIAVFVMTEVMGQPHGGCPITTNTSVALFTGNGAMADCIGWETHFWQWWATANPGELNIANVGSDAVQRSCELSKYPGLKFWVQPGGNAYDQQTSLGAAGKQNVLSFVGGGAGTLVATCAGWYVSASDYFWEGQHYSWPNTLGLYPTVEGSISDIIDFNTPPGYKMTGVSNGEQIEQMIYFGGPTQGWHNTRKGAVQGKTLLTFTDIAGDLPAAVQDGNKIFFSIHAEAYEGESITGLSTAQRLRNYKWRAQQINAAAGTNYKIPE